MRWTLRTIFSLAILVGVALSQAEDFTGKCIAVTDGDTIQVMHNGKAEKIRLDGIDAPESHQAWGTQAKNALSSLVFGKDVYVYDKGKERYGRTLGIVINPNNWDVNATLVKNGFAWHYKQYSKDPNLAKYELQARAEKKGLWKDANPIPPWDFRRGITSTSSTLPLVAAPIAPTTPLTTQAPRILPPQTAPSVHANTAAMTQTVYLTNTGTKYHLAGCRYLSKSSIPITLAQTAARYTPCSVCNPPALNQSSMPATVPSATASAIPSTSVAPQLYSYPTVTQTQTAMVYVTRTGAKYHRAGCRYLSKSSIPMPRAQAMQRYTPCSVCNP